MDEWLELHSVEIAESTAYNYQKLILQLKTNGFTDIPLKNVTKQYIQDFFIRFYEQGYARSTIICFGKVINMSLNYSVRQGYVAKSPYQNIVIPKKNSKEINPFLPDEVKRLLEVSMPGWLYDAILIAFKTGMRKGEIFALDKEKDIDYENGFIMVNHTQSLSRDGKIILTAPKTKSSKRRIDIGQSVINILKRRRDQTISNFLFSYKDGRMFIPWNISNTIKKKCENTGIEQKTFHDLRHGHATYLLVKGVHPKIVQERLGHSSISMTLDIYSHLIPGLQKVAADTMEELEF